MSLNSSFSLSVVVLSVSYCQTGRSDDSILLKTLKSRVDSVKTFQADAVYIRSSGKDCQALADAYIARNEWFKRNMLDWYHSETTNDAANIRSGPASAKRRMRYYWKEPHFIRVEEYGDVQADGTNSYPEPIVSVFNGERWEWLSPRATNKTDMNELHIIAREHDPLYFFEVARAAAVFKGKYLVDQPIGPVYRMLTQIAWGDLFKTIVPGEIHETSEPLPIGGDAKPVLHFAVAMGKKIKKPLVRFRVWFEPKEQYLPIRMESDYFEAISMGQDKYSKLGVVVWSEPIILSNGMRFASKCVVPTYDEFATPSIGVSPDDWPITRYEAGVSEIKFANVVVNRPLADDLFKIKPPPSTAVSDQVAGEKIIIGSSGEELKRIAIATRDEFPPRDHHWWNWGVWWIPIVVGSLAMTVLLIGYYVRRFRRR